MKLFPLVEIYFATGGNIDAFIKENLKISVCLKN